MEKQKFDLFAKQKQEGSPFTLKEGLGNNSPPKMEEKKGPFHLDLLNKLAGENLKMTSKQKKSPEEMVKAKLGSLLKNPGILLRRDTKDGKSIISREENTINNNLTTSNIPKTTNKEYLPNYTSEMKPQHLFSKSPAQIKTEPKETKSFNNIANNININNISDLNDSNQNSLLKKINEIKFNKLIMNKSNLMSSPKIITNVQKSSNLNNQSNQENSNNISNNNQSGASTYGKFNQNLFNVGLIKNRKKSNKNQEIGKTLNLLKTLNNNDNKFIDLKKGAYKEFNSVKSTNQADKDKKTQNSQTNDNISINNTSHNISVNVNQIQLTKEHRQNLNNESKILLGKRNDSFSDIYGNLEKILDELNENLNGKNRDKIIENSMKFFNEIKGKSKGLDRIIQKGQEFSRKLCEEYLKKCEKEMILKELIDKVNNENERLIKDSQDAEGNRNGRKEVNKNENNINSSSTNYTNTIHKNPKGLNSNFSKDNSQELKVLVKENQKLKNVILDQQNSLYQMKEKEGKLIKLLQGVKKRGIDLDEIFREEVVCENAENSEKNNESEIGNLHLVEDYPEKYITEKSLKVKPIPEFLQFQSKENARNSEEIDKNQADESIVNDSDESSFNYFGKPESIPTSIEMEVVVQPKKRNEGLKSNTTHLTAKLKDKLKLNLSNIQKKNLVQSSSDNNQDNKKKHFEKMAKIFQKKMSEQTHQYKLNKNEHEEMLKNIEEMGEIWKKMKK